MVMAGFAVDGFNTPRSKIIEELLREERYFFNTNRAIQPGCGKAT